MDRFERLRVRVERLRDRICKRYGIVVSFPRSYFSKHAFARHRTYHEMWVLFNLIRCLKPTCISSPIWGKEVKLTNSDFPWDRLEPTKALENLLPSLMLEARHSLGIWYDKFLDPLGERWLRPDLLLRLGRFERDGLKIRCDGRPLMDLERGKVHAGFPIPCLIIECKHAGIIAGIARKSKEETLEAIRSYSKLGRTIVVSASKARVEGLEVIEDCFDAKLLRARLRRVLSDVI